MDNIHAETAYEYGYYGQGITVAVVDVYGHGLVNVSAAIMVQIEGTVQA
ncbi:hypothetical protein NQX30_05920 [Candidatus Persebacteraceae bacterium Df01]|uniref:Uncharacterized protein n=1 Tax=Candidatus Doriopsillibacter californiensis TaxID=2970740 RepID=A0ABT7QMZ1_9GAMM|nr:hypothetical protein [Candidatus Persebacteraceae bacterium Df01]